MNFNILAKGEHKRENIDSFKIMVNTKMRTGTDKAVFGKLLDLHAM